jgi:hypothetical protein
MASLSTLGLDVEDGPSPRVSSRLPGIDEEAQDNQEEETLSDDDMKLTPRTR